MHMPQFISTPFSPGVCWAFEVEKQRAYAFVPLFIEEHNVSWSPLLMANVLQGC